MNKNADAGVTLVGLATTLCIIECAAFELRLPATSEPLHCTTLRKKTKPNANNSSVTQQRRWLARLRDTQTDRQRARGSFVVVVVVVINLNVNKSRCYYN